MVLASALLAAGILFGAGNHVDAASVKIDEKTFPDACVGHPSINMT